MYLEELLIIIVIAVAVVMYRNYQGQNVGKYITSQIQIIYDKFAPYSFKMVRDKTKELGQEYTVRQYAIQTALIAGFSAVISYLYFYSITPSGEFVKELSLCRAIFVAISYIYRFLRCLFVFLPKPAGAFFLLCGGGFR